jgi:hypothetical protein
VAYEYVQRAVLVEKLYEFAYFAFLVKQLQVYVVAILLVVLSATLFQRLNKLIDFHQTECKLYANGGYSSFVFL